MTNNDDKDLKDKINNPKIEPGVPYDHYNVHKKNNTKLIGTYTFTVIIILFTLGGLGIYLKNLWSNYKKEERTNEGLMLNKKEDDIIAKTKHDIEEEQKLVKELNNNSEQEIKDINTNIDTSSTEPNIDEVEVNNKVKEQSEEEKIMQRKLLSSLRLQINEISTDKANAGNILDGLSNVNSVKGLIPEVDNQKQDKQNSFAEFSKIDSDFRLGKGKNLTCTLQTKINTTYPGMTSCILTNDVYSDNGNTLLLEKGSIVIGQQQSALVNGQARVFIIWNEIKTPNDVVMNIDSGGADSLGASGSDANINNHFFKRLGGAILLSLLGEAINYSKEVSVSKQQKPGLVTNTHHGGNSTDEITNLAKEILQQNINIPPTAEVNQGTIINIMLAKDLDFSNVYQLQ